MEIEVMAEGWVGAMSFMRSIAITSGRSLGRCVLVCWGPRVRGVLVRMSFASGCMERSSSESSLSEPSTADEVRRRFLDF